jgi:hypothetical protein
MKFLRRLVRLFNPKKFKHGTLSLVMSAAFIAVVVLFNIVVSAVLSQIDTTVDMSANRLFSIEPETAAWLANIADEVTITVTDREVDFIAHGEWYHQTNEILRRFAGASDAITLEYVNLLTNPDFAAQFEEQLTGGSIIIRSANTGRHRVLQSTDYLAVTHYDLRTGAQITPTEFRMMQQMGMANTVHQDVSAGAEGAFLTTIMSITNTVPVNIGFTFGFDEGQNQHMLNLLLLNAYNAQAVDAMQPIPPDLDFLIIYAPKRDYPPEVLLQISEWLNNNGQLGRTLMYFADNAALTPNLEAFFADRGIDLQRAFVEQRDSRYLAPMTIAGFPMDVQFFAPNRFSERLNPAFRIFGDMMRHTRLIWESGHSGGVASVTRISPILSSYNGAVLRPFDIARDNFDYDSAKRGEFVVGAISSEEILPPGSFDPLYSHVVVFGGTPVFSGEFMIRGNANNASFFLAIMAELSGQDSDLPVIAPRSFEIPMFDITQEQAETLGTAFAIVLPLLLIIAGVVIWIRRIRS